MVIRLSFNGIEEKNYHNLCRQPKKATIGSLQNRLTAHIKNFQNDITTLFHRIIYALKHCKTENNDSLVKHLIMHLKNNSISIKNQDVVDQLFKELSPRVQNRALIKEYWDAREPLDAVVIAQPVMRSSEEKMRRNLEKAIAEHYGIKLANVPSLNLPIYHKTPHAVKIIEEYGSTEQGLRKSNEDIHFSVFLPGIGYLCGLCDGHSDDGLISAFVARRVQELFLAEYKSNARNFKVTMEKLFPLIQREIIENTNEEFDSGGSTATFALLNPTTGQLHVATLGDSEAKLFAKKPDGTIVPIPFSTQRNWLSPMETRRLEKMQGVTLITPEEIVQDARKRYGDDVPIYEKTIKPVLEYDDTKINVSRSFGDRDLVEKGLGYVKPTVSFLQLPVGMEFWFILACDGLWDYVDKDDKDLIAEFLEPNWDNPQKIDIAKGLTTYAFEPKFSADNISVVAMKIRS